jgi:hypothetical protein
VGSLASLGYQAAIEAQRPTNSYHEIQFDVLIHSYWYPEVHTDSHEEDGVEATLKASIIQSRQTQQSQKPIEVQSTHVENSPTSST